MILRSIDIRVPALCLSLVLFATGASGQRPGAQQPPATPGQLATPATGQAAGQAQGQAQTPAPPAPSTPARPTRPVMPPKKPKVPDYPDPRTLTTGFFYWEALPNNNYSLKGGTQAATYSSLYDLGAYKAGLLAEVSYPVTRTGELKFEGSLTKGDGNQIASVNTAPLSGSFIAGDYLSTVYTVETGKLYLDDLFYPYKFPVSKFRVKALYGLRYLLAKNVISAPLNTTESTAQGNRQLIEPALGMAVEYAISPHMLVRVDGSGFGIPHRAYCWDGTTYVTWRHGNLEVEAGYKALGFKTTPNKDEYVYGLISGGYAGIKYHWR